MPERYLGRSLGKFRIDAVVGSGGFAWVYKAFDPELEIPVALKVLKPHYAGDEQFEQRFRREASTAARLRHPNIVKIFAVGKESDAVYFAMDYLPQGLSDRLEVVPTLPEPVLIRMGIDVASAIGFAHREGVVHRDIKIDNILFDEHGNAVVADFGIARAVSNYAKQTGTNMVVGTPQYFSPEQARGLPLDGRADIYSLGVTLYRTATGVLPFNGEDWYEIARQHVEDRPVRPRQHNPSLSRDLERVILRCLEKAPGDRFESGEALAQALGALTPERSETIAMRSTPIRTSESPTAPIPMRGAARATWRRWAAWSSVAAAGIVAVVYAASAPRHGESPNRTSSSTPGPTVPPIQHESAVPMTPTPTDSVIRSGSAGATATIPSAPAEPPRAPPPGHPPRARSAPSPSPSASGNANGSSLAVPKVREYGTLRISAKPVGATYTLRDLEDGHTLHGPTPLEHPLTLPVGDYALTISNRYCASYQDTVRVTTNDLTPEVRVRLVCGQ